MANSCDAIIIGAGPAGLATAAALRARGLNAAILEKSDAVGSVWRRHYDRLHLHTDRAPLRPAGPVDTEAYGRYPSRAQVVEYLEAYAAKFELRPVFNTPVRTVRRDGRRWRAEAGENSQARRSSSSRPAWPISPFADLARHRDIRRPDPAFEPVPQSRSFAGKRVLVVGYGNSGGEIALDLAEASIDVTLRSAARSIRPPRTPRRADPLLSRSPSNGSPRASPIPQRAPIRFAVGSIEKLG